jgi:hypothetical protein
MPKLTEKEKKEKAKAAKEQKVRKILGEGIFPSGAKDALEATIQNFLDVKPMKEARKNITAQLKALDKAIAVLSPPKV